MTLAQFDAARDPDELFELAKQFYHTRDRQLAEGLARRVRSHPTATGRQAAAHALWFAPARLAPALLATLRDRQEDTRVRCEAAEALGHMGSRTIHRNRRWLARHLIPLLREDSADIRFWVAFALGTMRARTSVTALQALLGDERAVEGFHSVAKEAAAALLHITTRRWPD